MTISSKLATDFVKRNFDSFQFDSQTRRQCLTAYGVRNAYITVGCADIHPFCLDTGSTSCMMVLLPERLNADKSTLDEMFKQIDHEDMDMRSIIAGPNKYYRVTTNRLLVLEKLMKNSGFFNPLSALGPDQKDAIAAKIAEMQSEASSTYANTLKQLNELWAMINK